MKSLLAAAAVLSVWTAASAQTNCRQHYDVTTGKIYYGCEPAKPAPTPAPPKANCIYDPTSVPMTGFAPGDFCYRNPTLRDCPFVAAINKLQAYCTRVACMQQGTQAQQNAYSNCFEDGEARLGR
jgi:hypothetical protein